MNIQFVWPASSQRMTLDHCLTENQAVALHIASRCFRPHDNGHQDQDGDCVVFYWYMTRPVMLNLCTRHVCRLNDMELAYGDVQPLCHNSVIQAGHLKLVADDGADNDDAVRAFYQLIYPDNAWSQGSNVPEVEEVLPNGGYAVNDLRYFNDVVMARERGDDVLKTLEIEYKRFLLWQEQDGGDDMRHHPPSTTRIITDDRFEDIREQIKDKTLTECIIEHPFLMEKVWPEIMNSELADDIFMVEERVDILCALSPEYGTVKSKQSIPELVFQDFYKVGLDSHY